jgi:hypothetical protein
MLRKFTKAFSFQNICKSEKISSDPIFFSSPTRKNLRISSNIARDFTSDNKETNILNQKFRIGIVGSGASGFTCAKYLLKKLPNLEVGHLLKIQAFLDRHI